MLNATQGLTCLFFSYLQGGVSVIRDIIRVSIYDMKVRHKVSLLTATRKLENIFPSLPSPLAPLSSPDGGCALTFAGIILLCISIFLTLYT